MFRIICLLAAALASQIMGLAPNLVNAQQDHPTAMKLFPGETVVFVRTANARLFLDRLRASSMGQMLTDPQVTPMLEDIYGSVRDEYSDDFEERTGVGLDDLRRLPQGEVAFGVVDRGGSQPGILLLVDFGDELEVAEQVVSRLEERAQDSGGELTTEQLGLDEIKVYRPGNDASRMVGLVRRGSVFLLSNDRLLIESTLAKWDNRPVASAAGDDSTSPAYAATLAENETFAKIVKECLPGREEPPQLIAFIDPLRLFKAFNREDTGARVFLAMLPALGLDGLQGIGVATWHATDTWDTLIRGHLCLDNPRAGILKIARFDAGDPSPPALVPDDVSTYITAKIDAPRMFNEIAMLVDRFRYEGSFRELVDQNMSSNLGVDFEQQVINNLTGRLVWITGYEQTDGRPGGRTAFAVPLVDPDEGKRTLESIVAKFSDNLERKKLGDIDYVVFNPFEGMPEGLRPPSSAFAIVGDSFVVCQGEELLAKLIETDQNQHASLADSIQYRLVTSRLSRLAGEAQPAALMFNNSEPMIRYWHTLLQSDRAREFFDSPDRQNVVVQTLATALKEGRLPPVETLLKYTAPGGGVVYDTTTGFHFMSFSFKRQ